MIYDFLKLLDRKNPFKLAISFNLLLRKHRLTRGARLTNLENHMNSTLQEATSRLKDQICDQRRKLLFIITEIAEDNTSRHWICNNMKGKFEKTNI